MVFKLYCIQSKTSAVSEVVQILSSVILCKLRVIYSAFKTA